jgi:uncharacterized protein YeaO (DUF488 family)
MPPGIEVVRVYDRPGPSPGRLRVLVDRLWPRGITKAEAPFDEWLKEVAPSTELRKWYGHVPERFEEFSRRYRQELSRPPAQDAFRSLQTAAARSHLQLVTATREVDLSAATVLAAALRGG